MDVDNVRATVEQLVEEWSRQRLLAEDADRKAKALSKIIRGYVEMYPELEAASQITTEATAVDYPPRGAEAVRLILQDSPNVWFYVSELVGLLRERGWLPESENPANAVRTALERLVANSDDTDVVKGRIDGKVTYTYMPDRDREPPEPPSAGYSYDEEPF